MVSYAKRQTIFLVIMAVLSLAPTGLVKAHSPHDVIDILALSPSYDKDRTLFIVLSDRLRRSRDGGHSWKDLVNGLNNKYPFTDMAVSPTFRDDASIFISSDGDGIYRSQDRGNSWVRVNSGLGSLRIDLLAIHSSYAARRIVLASGAEGGLYWTNNGGHSWQQVMTRQVRIVALAFFSGELRNQVLFTARHRRHRSRLVRHSRTGLPFPSLRFL